MQGGRQQGCVCCNTVGGVPSHGMGKKEKQETREGQSAIGWSNTSRDGITHTLPRAHPPTLPPSLSPCKCASAQSIDGKTYHNCLLHKILALPMACWLLVSTSGWWQATLAFRRLARSTRTLSTHCQHLPCNYEVKAQREGFASTWKIGC